MPKEMEKTGQSIEPEQIVSSESASAEQLEIHTIPDKYYGAAMRASLEAAKRKQPESTAAQPDSGTKKKKSPVVWIVAGLFLILAVSGGGFVYFNRSLIFGEKAPPQTPIVQQPPAMPTPPPAPSAPTNAVATATSQTVVQLNWMDNSNNEAGFRIERREPTTQFVAVTSLPPNSSAYQDRTVTAQKDYLYRVIASNEGGDSSPSNEAAAQTPVEPPPAPEPAKLPPAGLDTDSDGVTDLEEPLYGTNANDPDTDHDTFLDGNEVFHLYNPASGLNTRLLDTGLVKVSDSAIGWSIYVPTVWKVTMNQDGMKGTFATGRGESFVIIMHPNKERKPVMDWYLESHPGILSTQVTPITTKTGLLGLEGENKLHTYFPWGDWILDFQYELDGQPFVNFRQTYEMMKNSLKLTAVPLVSTEVLQSYEQQNSTSSTAPVTNEAAAPAAIEPANPSVATSTMP